MNTPTVASKGKVTYVGHGGKIFAISEGIVREVPTVRGRARRISLKFRTGLLAHWRHQRVLAMQKVRAEEPVEDLDVQDDFNNVVRSAIRNSMILGGRAGLQIVKQKQKDLPFFSAEEPDVLNFVEQYSGSLITQIDDFTLSEVRRVVGAGLERGIGVRGITNDLGDKFNSWRSPGGGKQSRANLISRTEVGRSVNVGTIAGYRQSGLVETVEVSDGESDEPCRLADGQIWTLDEAEKRPIQHPNCIRSFLPIIAEG